MPNKRLLTCLKELLHPPFASTTLMMLLCFIWLMGIQESLALAPHLLVSPLQAYRVVTYCLCSPDAALFGFSLLLFPLLGWPLEWEQGTLRYLHGSVLGAATSALLYLLLSGLWKAQPGAAVSGYTPVHLALLGCQQRQRSSSRWTSTAALAGLLLTVGQALSPEGPFLLHLCGLLTGLAFCLGLFLPLELSERQLEKLHSGIICRTLRARSFFLQFVVPPASTVLPVTDFAAGRERHVLHQKAPSPRVPFPRPQGQPTYPANVASQPVHPASPTTSDWSGLSSGLGWETRQSLASGSPPGLLAHYGVPSIPFSNLPESLTDEALLQAGIQASLQDVAREEVSLSKSSVSSLRLQQLQKMGFPTEEAVVALAATGHVEGAVSLLIGGHIGDKAVVTGESRSAPRQWPLSGTQQ